MIKASASTVLKRPAAASANPLKFPGEGKREPLRCGKSVVYFSDRRFRLMRKASDRVDVAYPYRSRTAREAWSDLALELQRLNPRV